MIIQVRIQARIEDKFPRRVNRGNAQPQQWMHRIAQPLLHGQIRFDPALFVTPRIAWQSHEFAVTLIDRFPINGYPTSMQPSQVHQNLFRFVRLATKRVQYRGFLIVIRHAIFDGRSQRRVRTDFQEYAVVGILGACQTSRHPGREEYRFADIAPPVHGIQLLTQQDSAGDSRDHRNVARLRIDTRKRC